MSVGHEHLQQEHPYPLPSVATRTNLAGAVAARGASARAAYNRAEPERPSYRVQ
jgi:hypothetical protein